MLNLDDRLIRDILPTIKPNAFAVLMAISIHLNTKTGQAFPSNPTLRKITGLGRDAVESALAVLKENGLLVAYYSKGQNGHFQKRKLKITTKFIKIWVDADETAEFDESIDNEQDVLPYPEKPCTDEPCTEKQGHNCINKLNTPVSEKETECAFTFDEFWKCYDYRKGSKANAAAKFKKLSVRDKEQIRETLPLYLHDTVTSDILRGEQFRPMRKHAEFYLSGKIWETYADIAAQRQKENEETLPEWTDAYNEYLDWVKRKYQNILQSAKYLSKQQYASYRSEYYVQGKSFIGESRERKELIKVHDDMNANPDLINRYTDVFALHCERIKQAVKEYQI